jgi:hypothetical protein
MVTLKVKIGLLGKTFPVEWIDLSTHWPIDVMRIIVERDPSKKPPSGSIWIMKLPVLTGGTSDVDHFDTLKANGIDGQIELILIEIKK